jgi:hypothetical protein
MAERTKVTAPATRPVPMKLFATWEVDRTPPNCIPRSLFALIILAFNRPPSLGVSPRYGFDANICTFQETNTGNLCALFSLFTWRVPFDFTFEFYDNLWVDKCVTFFP